MLRCVGLLWSLALAWWIPAVAAASPGAPAPEAAGDGARLTLLARLVQDDSPKVRVEALRALAKVRTARAAELALGVLRKPMDATLDYALWLTINDLAEPWMASVRSGEWKTEGREDQLAFALRALKPEQVGRVLGSILGDRPLPRDGSGPWIEVIGAAGTPAHVGRLIVQAGAGGFDGTATARALKAAGEAIRLRQVKPEADPAVLGAFLAGPPAESRSEAIRLAGLWKSETSVAPLLGLAGAPSGGAPGDRARAFESLRQIGSASVKAGLRALTTASHEPAIRQGAATALLALDSTDGLKAVLEVTETLTTEAEAMGYWRAVLGVKAAAPLLREALEGRKLPEGVARAGMRVAREGGRNDIELVARLAEAGGLTTDTRQLTGDLLKELAEAAAKQGDPHRGEAVFRRASLACLTCHAIGGAGGKVGPDLTSIGASAPMDYLVEALLLPNAKIKEGYPAVIVELRDGEETTGTLARETQEELFLRLASGQELAIPKNRIARREIGRLSLMPAGLLEPLSEGDRLDLYAFLGRLGKPGDFDASRGGVARRWRIGMVVHTDLQNNDGDWFWKRALEDRRWTPVYSLASGHLTRAVLDESIQAQAWVGQVAVVAATEVDQAVGGRVVFRTGVADAEVWVDGQRWGAGAEAAGELGVGRHRVVLRLDPRKMPERLRLEGEGTAFVLE